jgi:intein/homing endonuclease
LETEDISFINQVYNKITNFLDTKTNVKIRQAKNNKFQTYYFQLRNKEFYFYLTEILDLPKGSKSTNLRAPKVILNSNKSLQKSFIAGLFDADGGIRGRNIGFTMKNKDFMLDIKKLLLNLSINASEDSWFNKKYKRNYYGLRLNKQSTAKFLKIIPVSNTEKLKRVYEHTNLIFAGQRD